MYDGSGAAGRIADVLVEGDRVVGVGESPAETSAQVLDASGLTVAPGFINVLSHAWGSLQLDGSGASDVMQGVTTEVFGEAYSLGPSDERFRSLLGADDTSGLELIFDHLREGLDHLVGRGVAPNIASFIGGTNLRILGAGFEERPLTGNELDTLRALVAQEMQEGALGIGTALIYPPGRFAETSELTSLCEVVGQYDGVYISHLRSEGDRFLDCLDELLAIGRDALCRTELYHLKAVGRHNWHKMQLAIDRIEKARADGQLVTANMYPYTAGGTALDASIPPSFHVGGPEAFRARLQDPAQREAMAAAIRVPDASFENLYFACGPDGVLLTADLDDGTPAAGKNLTQLAAELGYADPALALVEIVRRSPSLGALYFMAAETNVELGLSQPWVSLGSDAAATRADPHAISGHPRSFGTFSRFLGHYVRDRKLTTLADGIRRMTSLPADTFGLKGRGQLREGSFADLVVFDAKTIADTATYERFASYATGVRDVIINGHVVVADGALTDARPGRRLARQR